MFHVEHLYRKMLPSNVLEGFIEKIDILEKEYFKWNSKINISGIKDKESFIINHIIDSLCLANYIENNKKCFVYDIGSGGGFPGLVLSILGFNVVMVEPVEKKISFSKRISRVLNLKADFINKRYQDYDNYKKESIIVSRAFGEMNQLYSYFKNKSEKIIFMTTNKAIKDKNIKGLIDSKCYDLINPLINNRLSDHIIFDCLK